MRQLELRTLHHQIIESMREYMAENSAPIHSKREMMSGMLIFAARSGILTYHQYRRLTKIKNNFFKARMAMENKNA